MGDGVLAYFGYPQAHEDDAERAVRAGLQIVEAVPQAVPGQTLAVRVGIATGPVVVGDSIGHGAAQESAVVGVTPNLAARLQGIAPDDSVVVSPSTQRLVAGRFKLERSPARRVKGLDEPVSPFKVLGVRADRSRFEAAQRGALSPLLGRDAELALLERRWGQAQAGEGQAVLLQGEPGIGKSRLIQAVRERVGADATVVLRYQCSPHHTATAFYPVTELLGRAAQFSSNDEPASKLDKLEAMMAGLLPGNETALALVAALLSLPVERYVPLDMTAQAQRAATIDALAAMLESLQRRGPTLVLFEDVHWSDPSTLDYLDAVIDRMASLPVLALVTYRPEFQPTWGGYGHVTTHSLNRLGRREVSGIVAGVSGGKALPPEVLSQIEVKTDGIPLFVEELTKTVLEAGFLVETDTSYALEGPVPHLAIPSTLHDALLARLDRLASAKEIAQIGACIGRTFSYELIAAAAPASGDALDAALETLSASELVFRRGKPPAARFTFKHALVQDAAYQSLLRTARKKHHARIARALETRFPSTVETQPELIAHHYTQAAEGDRAVGYWLAAGRRAAERSAHAEAIAHLEQGLEVLGVLPDTSERAAQELDLQAALGPALMVTKGQTAPETERAYTRARELCDRVGDTPHRFPVLWGLWYLYLGLGQLHTARERAEELLEVARRSSDSALLIPAQRALGNSLLWLGELAAGCRFLEEAVAMHDVDRHGSLLHRYGQDQSVVCGSWASWARWIMGDPDLALAHVDAALARAEAVEHPLSHGFALNSKAWVHLWRGEGPAAEVAGRAAMELCSEQGFAVYLAWARVAHGGALALQGQGEQGIAGIRQGLADWDALGIRIGRAKLLVTLADAHLRAGQWEAGLDCLDHAATREAESGERLFRAERLRLYGELMLRRSPDAAPQAERRFREAIELARAQQARSYELRAATSLARLYGQQGRREEALALLRPVHDGFTEGFETADLQAATALLETLSS
jgi:predicted ATPase